MTEQPQANLATTPIQMKILEVRDIGFKMDENLFIPRKEAIVNFNQVTHIDKDKNVLICDVRITFHYGEDPTNLLIESNSKNVFEVKELGKYVTAENNLALPAIAIVTIIGLAVAHARALICKNTAGSAYQFTIVPLVDAAAMSKVFFPYIIPELEKMNMSNIK